ncbi:MAG: RNase adapter RapZ [Acidobacteria bacterium]|nr:RNase adapter RapZ [Acidobacteriota bacterium]
MTGDGNPTDPQATPTRFVVVTGLSGAGKSQAIRALEDLGYLCVDNLPTALLAAFADLTAAGAGATGGARASAAVLDVRDPHFLDAFPVALRRLRQRKDLGVVVLFIEASDEALVRRYSETRRPHPLAPDRSVLEGILEERTRLETIKRGADRVINTSDLTVHELRAVFSELSRSGAAARLVVTLISFGYKHGVPLESDLLLDVRFLPNPHFVPHLRPRTGVDPEVQNYVGGFDAAQEFLGRVTGLLRFLLPQYAREGKSYLTIGIGCTGGRHRSVAIIERLRQQMTDLHNIHLLVKHRDITTPGDAE